jgi:RES domain-containing protein
LTTTYRLCSSSYSANSGAGAAKHGGRWNLPSTPVIYCSATASLAALEILVHFSVLPINYTLTEIRIPDHLLIKIVDIASLPPGWDAPSYHPDLQLLGTSWASRRASVALSVPSSVVRSERNYLINPEHPDFEEIQFLPSTPFRFDPRLK